MQARVALLERTLVEMEATDTLRDRASAVLREELAEMRRRESRGRVDLTYVKSVRAVGLGSLSSSGLRDQHLRLRVDLTYFKLMRAARSYSTGHSSRCVC